jgi:hypothetical protein
VDLNFHLMVKGKFTNLDGTPVALDDRNPAVNNLLHSLFSQLNVTLNGVPITPSEDLYHYRSYLETLLTYGHDAATKSSNNRSLFSGSGNHHTNNGIQNTHDMYIAGHFMLLFDLTPDVAASEGHISLPSSSNVRIELQLTNSVVLVCERSIPIERPPLVGEVSTNFCG